MRSHANSANKSVATCNLNVGRSLPSICLSRKHARRPVLYDSCDEQGRTYYASDPSSSPPPSGAETSAWSIPSALRNLTLAL